MSYPAGFSLQRDNAEVEMIALPVSSVTAAVGDVLELVDGAATWAAVTSSSNARTLKAVVQTAVTSSDTEAKGILITPSQLWVAEVANTSSASHIGDRMAFTDANTINNSGSDQTGATGCFQQLAVVGATGDLRVLGRFTGLYGNATI